MLEILAIYLITYRVSLRNLTYFQVVKRGTIIFSYSNNIKFSDAPSARISLKIYASVKSSNTRYNKRASDRRVPEGLLNAILRCILRLHRLVCRSVHLLNARSCFPTIQRALNKGEHRRLWRMSFCVAISRK